MGGQGPRGGWGRGECYTALIYTDFLQFFLCWLVYYDKFQVAVEEDSVAVPAEGKEEEVGVAILVVAEEVDLKSRNDIVIPEEATAALLLHNKL